ncbi:hypothetical protein I547_7408 [Mycobacterium kansasii 824]|nr:hypothetical protein I547_7408 [Mycobacterium kansasii 824]
MVAGLAETTAMAAISARRPLLLRDVVVVTIGRWPSDEP